MEEKKLNYHWAESDISEWARDGIRQALESRGYTVHEMDVMTKVCQRMNTLGLVYMISFECVKDGKYCGVRGFYSVSEKANGIEDFEWFPGFFKEMEAEAVLKFGDRVLDVDRPVERKPCVKNIAAEDAKSVDVTYRASINCGVDELKSFILSPEFISVWSGHRALFESGRVLIDGVEMHDLREDSRCIKMGWKRAEWAVVSDVRMELESFLSSTKVKVVQKGVPIKEAGSVRAWWHERVFAPISGSFGFMLKPGE